MLPRVKINYLNGQLGTVPESEDGLFGLVGATDGSWTLPELYTPYTVVSVDDFVQQMGSITEGLVPLKERIEQFYSIAPSGTKLVIYVPDEEVSAIVNDPKSAYGDFLREMGGKLRGLFVDLPHDNEGRTLEECAAKFQELGEWAATELYSPLFSVLPSDSDEVSFASKKYNRVAIIAGSPEEGYGNNVGYLAGRLASIPVHRNIGRVKDGAIPSTEMWIGTDAVVPGLPQISSLHESRFITPRTYVGLSGYYFADDCMACDPTDDYAHLTARRTVDKAYRIAYQTLVQFMLDEIEVNEDGTMQNGVLKSWQQAVENAINRQMTAKGELSATDGEGCVCFIDPKQNVLATSRIELTLKVRPYGYARFIDVNLGFQVTA